MFLFVSLFLFWVNYYLLFVVYDIKKVARFDIVADKDLFITGYTYETLEKLKKISEIKEYSIDIKKTQKTLYNLDQLFLPQLSKDTNKLKYYFNELEISLILSLKNEYVEYFYNVIKGYLTVKLENGIELEDIPDVVKEINDVLDINKLSSNPKEIQKLIAYKKIILTKLPKLIEFNKIFDIQKTLDYLRASTPATISSNSLVIASCLFLKNNNFKSFIKFSALSVAVFIAINLALNSDNLLSNIN